MRFYLLGADGEVNKPALSAELQAAKQWGKLFLGKEHLFFRAGWFKVCAIPYGVVRRCFRRVQLIPLKLRGDQQRNIVDRGAFRARFVSTVPDERLVGPRDGASPRLHDRGLHVRQVPEAPGN